jgi:hypothetical protein
VATKKSKAAPANDSVENGSVYVWIPERDGAYASEGGRTKDIHKALQFPTKEACESWIGVQAGDPAGWEPVEHGFADISDVLLVAGEDLGGGNVIAHDAVVLVPQVAPGPVVVSEAKQAAKVWIKTVRSMRPDHHAGFLAYCREKGHVTKTPTEWRDILDLYRKSPVR